jgi:hypothetical protein
MVGVHDARQIRWPQRVLPVELLQDFAQGTQLPIMFTCQEPEQSQFPESQVLE